MRAEAGRFRARVVRNVVEHLLVASLFPVRVALAQLFGAEEREGGDDDDNEKRNEEDPDRFQTSCKESY